MGRKWSGAAKLRLAFDRLVYTALDEGEELEVDFMLHDLAMNAHIIEGSGADEAMFRDALDRAVKKGRVGCRTDKARTLFRLLTPLEQLGAVAPDASVRKR